MASARTEDLRALAQRLADALPPVVEEVVLTGSVSRGVADELSDVEQLVVTREQLDLAECFEHARAAGLVELDSWGAQGTATSRVFGYCDGVPVELIWWSREHAEASVAAIFAGEGLSSADALANGVPLRTVGLLDRWQERLRVYPEELAAALVEEAALAWGGFAPEGILTIARPGERLALVERSLDDCARVLQIVYAVNRVWPRTAKRLAARVEALPVRPERLAERVEEALTEPEPVRALLAVAELQADTLALAPDGPNVDRARVWVGRVIRILRAA
jgi:hypothetical protein